MAVTWDLSSFFPTFEGPERAAFRRAVEADLAALERRSAVLPPLGAASLDAWEGVLLALEDVGSRLGHLWRYLGCLTAAHADREDYAAEDASLAALAASLRKVEVDLTETLKAASDEVVQALLAREAVAPVAYHVRRMRERGRHTMTRNQERLAADLLVDGSQAFGRLYDRLTGTLEFEMAWPDGRRERLPVSRWRALMADADREVGRAAFLGGNEAWARQETVLAAALNALGGTRLTLARYRGQADALEPALFEAAVTPATLSAMREAIRAGAPTAREVVRTRARAMGRPGIWFFEREAPLPGLPAGHLSWEQGTGLVERAFARVYPALADYLRDVLARRWVEAEARAGKRPGAFCTSSTWTDEERVYLTWSGTLEDVRTLAHEVGHGWHARVLRGTRPFARAYPMTLAETASTFAEQILAEGVLQDPSVPARARLAMLDTELVGAANMLLDITARFEFERRFHEERAAGELPASRLRELMARVQREVYGDTLVPGGEDPMFWASKLHFFLADLSFYNFPYTFGFLLTRALHARMREEGAAFLPRYEEFLRWTGRDTADGVVRRTLGEDTTDPEFWARAIRTLDEPLAAFRDAVAAVPAQRL